MIKWSPKGSFHPISCFVAYPDSPQLSLHCQRSSREWTPCRQLDVNCLTSLQNFEFEKLSHHAFEETQISLLKLVDQFGSSVELTNDTLDPVPSFVLMELTCSSLTTVANFNKPQALPATTYETSYLESTLRLLCTHCFRYYRPIVHTNLLPLTTTRY